MQHAVQVRSRTREISEQLQALEDGDAGIDQAPDGAVQEGENKAPEGADKEESAALAAPASAKVAPQIQVGDRVGVDMPGDPWHDMEGVVTKATSTGSFDVNFGSTGTSRFGPSSLKVIAAALWPFPGEAKAKPGKLGLGASVLVKGDQASKHAGMLGTVSGQVMGTDRWQVRFGANVGKAAKIVEFKAADLEVQA